MNELERYFKGLADRSRLRIINLLMHGELCGCDIQYVLEASQPNISRHLTYLKNAGLVCDRRDGYRIFYRLADDHQPGTKRLLFELLKPVLRSDDSLHKDTELLKRAVAAGSCTLSEWRPYRAFESDKPSASRRR
jgi:ArsR family transcriptional regulator, arsenate/arsenite/antimonite-responsive transcriptional repressor